MPSMYAHYSCGKKVLDILPREIQELINSHKSLYLTGLQGPDVLFYYKPLKKNRVSTYGNEMHDRPAAGFFRAAAQRLCEAESSQAAAMQSYLLGFVCHFALDSICHGYVEKKIAASGVSHIQIEAEFDRFLLQKDGHDPLRYRTADSLRAGSARSAAENARVISRCFGDISPAEIRKAIKSMISYSNFLLCPDTPKGNAKRKAIYAALKATGKYDSLRHMIPSKDGEPACADSNLRLQKLMDQKAVPLAARLIESCLAFLQGGGSLDPWFDRTFGPDDGWPNIRICTLEEEKIYEI